MRSLEHVVVVGASLAGLRAVETLRTDGFTGRVTLIGAETHLPYDRPPLSKKLLAGDWDADRIALRQADGHRRSSASTSASACRRPGSTSTAAPSTLADDRVVPFDGLVIATGSGTRRLPGQELVPTVHELRTLDDALALRAVIADGTARVVVVGAGFIGLEVAATARAWGCTVTVLEGAPGAADPRPRCRRWAPPPPPRSSPTASTSAATSPSPSCRRRRAPGRRLARARPT